MKSKSTSFTAERVNDTTFLIIEDDSWHERPHIYALLHPVLPVLVLSDTGCDSPQKHGLSTTHLRDFLENYPVVSNNNKPLNPGPNCREYMVLCTHCHYDHIGAIEQFSLPDSTSNSGRATIVASKAGRVFIENDLPEHSICKYVGIPTPRYEVDLWAGDFERLTYPFRPARMNMEASQFLPESASDLGITIINTPGHTPDELAWYDHSERHLYVGDSFYEEGQEGMAIQFSKEGNWNDFMSSMTKLLDFVRKENSAVAEDPDGWLEVAKRVRVGCGHTTTSADGESMLEDVIELFERIITGKVPVLRSFQQRGEIHNVWREQGKNVRFSVDAPRRLCEEVRERMQVDIDGSIETRSLDGNTSGFLRSLRLSSLSGGHIFG